MFLDVNLTQIFSWFVAKDETQYMTVRDLSVCARRIHKSAQLRAAPGGDGSNGRTGEGGALRIRLCGVHLWLVLLPVLGIICRREVTMSGKRRLS